MTARARLLVVEDDDALRSTLVQALEAADYATVGRPDGADLAEAMQTHRPDMVLLDVMVPGRDGFALAREVRRRSDAAVLILTARDAMPDRLRGFEVGADDYLAKPFAMAELLARISAVLRRLGRLPSVIEVGDLVVDESEGVARRGGVALDLTATEFRLLDYLVTERGRTMSKTQILTQVWGYGDYDPNLVEVHVSALRRKLEAHGDRVLHTVRGIGYVVRG